MYLSKAYVLTAISRMTEIHPFYGITFLSCKKNKLPVGESVPYQMDGNTKAFMDEIHKLDPVSGYYFQPFASSARDKYWVSVKYPSSGLQAINTQTFSGAFLHIKKEKTWGWSNNYLDILKTQLRNNELLSIFDLAVWVFKGKKWPDSANLQTVIQTFIEEFEITDGERTQLFTNKIESYPCVNPFQEFPVSWDDLRNELSSPPDASPSRGATLSYLELVNVGPARMMRIEPRSRLNIITGDNALGKSFLMDCSWWALTGTWVDTPAYPFNTNERHKARITFDLVSESTRPYREVIKYDIKQGIWPRTQHATKSSSVPGLIIYARVDGSYAVWDPVQQYSNSMSNKRKYVFSRNEVWDGADDIEGLIRDWVKWQNSPDKYPFDILVSVLKEMSPPDMGMLHPGQPIRILSDRRDMPTIIHPYGEVPINNISAGVRRIVTLAYLIVWAWHEHRIGAELIGSNTENRMVILIDEIEAHLHPKWQRVILPALLNIKSFLSSQLEIQFILSTHSPLVLASAESLFSAETDGLFNIIANPLTGEAELNPIDFIKYGQVNAWLTSPVFNLGQARSQGAEKAIERAKKLQLQSSSDFSEVVSVHEQLLKELPETDSFWPRWLFFAEKNGVTI
jgi:hypothetical protein